MARLWLVVLMVLIGGCTFQQGEAGPATEMAILPTPTSTEVDPEMVQDTLRILNWQAPDILNPHLTNAFKNWDAARVTYEPLASYDKTGQLVPFLAAEIPTLENGGVAPDSTSVTWTLRQDVLWSDGEPFTAEDVVFTYEYVTNPAVQASSAVAYTGISTVAALDEHTVRVEFTTPTPFWAQAFVGLRGLILPRHKFEAYNGLNAMEAPANFTPVGTGPYRVMEPGIKPQEVIFLGSEIVETNKILFERNPHYYDGTPYFDNVEWLGGGTVNEAARQVLLSDFIDYAIYITLADNIVAQADRGPGELVIIESPELERIMLNRTDPRRETADGELSSVEFPHPFLSDKTVRQAIAHAINREAIADLYGPLGRLTRNALFNPSSFASPNTFYDYDLERAAQLLDEAGWVDSNGNGIRDKDGVELRLTSQATFGSVVQATQQLIRNDLESIGFDVNFELVDPSIYYGDPTANPNAYPRFTADLQEVALSSFSPDPTQYMEAWTCDNIPQKENNWAGFNNERWCNPAYDALLAQVKQEVDPDIRRDLFIQMNDMLIEDVVMIPLVNTFWISGAQPTIEGIDPTPWDGEAWNIKDWRRVTLP